MKNWDSQINTVRALAAMVWCVIILAIFLPNHREALLQAAFILGGGVVGQLFLRARSIEPREAECDAEKTRLNIG